MLVTWCSCHNSVKQTCYYLNKIVAGFDRCLCEQVGLIALNVIGDELDAVEVEASPVRIHVLC